VALIEVGECIFDEQQFGRSHGFDSLDPVGREAFVNHVHLAGSDSGEAAARIVASWVAEMRTRWPDKTFRIYRAVQGNEVTVRFHLARPGLPNWCEQGIEIITVPSIITGT
jgi:hypothetical protein